MLKIGGRGALGMQYSRKRLFSSRKGDAGVAAATLVLLITLIIVFFVNLLF